MSRKSSLVDEIMRASLLEFRDKHGRLPDDPAITTLLMSICYHMLEIIEGSGCGLPDIDFEEDGDVYHGSWSHGVEAIAKERDRQLVDEGYDEGHDQNHDNNELARAAIAYLLSYTGEPRAEMLWPRGEGFKPAEGRVKDRDLEKAGALIAAQIDRNVKKGEL